MDRAVMIASPPDARPRANPLPCRHVRSAAAMIMVAAVAAGAAAAGPSKSSGGSSHASPPASHGGGGGGFGGARGGGGGGFGGFGGMRGGGGGAAAAPHIPGGMGHMSGGGVHMPGGGGAHLPGGGGAHMPGGMAGGAGGGAHLPSSLAHTPSAMAHPAHTAGGETAGHDRHAALEHRSTRAVPHASPERDHRAEHEPASDRDRPSERQRQADREHPFGHEHETPGERDHVAGHEHLPGHGFGQPHRFAYARPEIPGQHRLAPLAPRPFLRAAEHRDIARERAFVAAHHAAFHSRFVRDFDRRERMLWRRGLWRSEWHYGRRGWWWEAGGEWYPYPEPIFPYPVEVADIQVYDQPVVDGPDLEPLVAQPEDPNTETAYAALVAGDPQAADAPLIPPLPAPPQGWYYCPNPSGYFPDINTCSVDWQLVQDAPPAP